MKIWETYDFVFDSVRQAGKEVGGVVVEAVKDVAEVFIPDILLDCFHENEECERCGDCGKELEDVEDEERD